jgi:hypothetical protein
MGQAVALGLRAHSEWTAVVAVAGSPIEPIVLERRRIDTADDRLAGSKQPYHAARELSDERAAILIRRCRESSRLLAIRAVSALVTQIRESGFTVVGAAVLLASGRPLPPLAAILRSHALIHTAEGEFFREVLLAASEHCSLQVMKVTERDIWETAGRAFGLPITDLQRRIGQLATSVGPPWRQDEKLASLAAWIALFGSK